MPVFLLGVLAYAAAYAVAAPFLTFWPTIGVAAMAQLLVGMLATAVAGY